MALYILQQIVLGAAQGIFEWVPISSEGIVALLAKFWQINLNPVDLALFLHLGTLLAVLVYFRADFKDILLLRDKKMFRFLFIATCASLALGFLLYQFVHNMALGNSLLLLTGFGLLATAFFQKKKNRVFLQGDKLALFVGILQGLSIVPGLSRSGSTIFGLSFGESEPKKILKVSYLMSAPVVLASTLYLLLENPPLASSGWLGFCVAFVVGFLSLRFMLRIAEKINFFKFALVFGLICFLGALIGFLV